jgi:3D (Asp-Asp-Asp) domain-containing protein
MARKKKPNMCINFKFPVWSRSLLIFVLGFSSLLLAFRFNSAAAQETVPTISDPNQAANGAKLEIAFCGLMISRANLLELKNETGTCSKNNSDLSFSGSTIRRIRVVLTAYSSTVAQTDSTPFLTANGTYVHDGVVANNGLPFGTQIRIPELYGDKVFSVEDRMHWRMGSHRFDIWFPTYEQAKNFGVRYAYVEVLEK